MPWSYRKLSVHEREGIQLLSSDKKKMVVVHGLTHYMKQCAVGPVWSQAGRRWLSEAPILLLFPLGGATEPVAAGR